jgi:hypothetical protein
MFSLIIARLRLLFRLPAIDFAAFSQLLLRIECSLLSFACPL